MQDNNFLEIAKVLGKFDSTSPSGEKWTTTVYDLECWATGNVMVRQEGEGQVHDQMHSREDCKVLGVLLLSFAYPEADFSRDLSARSTQ
jgi:hypothetical protein